MAVGLLGKLPSHGDFLRRGVASELAAPLDAWLAAAVAASRETLGAGWLDAYLTAPVWRFALAAGTCGSATAAGIWLPSVDRVGRYFPLLAVAQLATVPSPVALLQGARAWYDRLEELVLAVLEDRVTLPELEASLAAIAPPEPLAGAGPLPWRLAPADPAGWQLAALAPIGSLWWGEGSPRVPASLLACAGLPPPGAFAAMLDGGFPAHGWSEAAA